jgi:hypothetical protein
MTTCDWCYTTLPLDNLFNVEYKGDWKNYANVLCELCLNEAMELEQFVEAWR